MEDETELELLSCTWSKEDCKDRNKDGLCEATEDCCPYDDELSGIIDTANREERK